MVKRLGTGCVTVVILLGASVGAQTLTTSAKGSGKPVVGAIVTAVPMTPANMMDSMIAHEQASAEHRNPYMYLSTERSDRTGGKLWTERVVETPQGRIRMLLAVDGVSLNAEQEGQERGRLAEILRDPGPFIKKEADLQHDELHARQMINLLPKAFLFDNMRQDGENVRIDFKPNPAYQTQSMEERVLHSMSGSVLIDAKAMRMRKIEARLPVDISFGFGLLATIRAGTNFVTVREPVESGEWKTTGIDTRIDGKALFFKTLSRSEQAEHTEFHRVPNDLTLAQAVAMLEK